MERDRVSVRIFDKTFSVGRERLSRNMKSFSKLFRAGGRRPGEPTGVKPSPDLSADVLAAATTVLDERDEQSS